MFHTALLREFSFLPFLIPFFSLLFSSFLFSSLLFSFFLFVSLLSLHCIIFFSFIGMSSGVAMGKHAGGLAEYRSSEGKAVTLPYRGMIKATINDILGGIRSSCTYVGARYSTRTCFKSLRDFFPVDIEYISRVPLTQSPPHHLIT